jgi:hypothetical protein
VTLHYKAEGLYNFTQLIVHMPSLLIGIVMMMRPRTNKPGRPPKGDFHLGQKFNSWTILSKEPNSKKHRCQCDCGAIELVAARNVVNGYSKRCRSCAAKIPRKPYRSRVTKNPKIFMETI